jgi:hypothetical protein
MLGWIMPAPSALLGHRALKALDEPVHRHGLADAAGRADKKRRRLQVERGGGALGGRLRVQQARGTRAGVGVARIGDDAVKRSAVREVLLTQQHGRGLDGILREGAGGGAGPQRKEQRQVGALEVVLAPDVARRAGGFEARDIRDAGTVGGNGQLGHWGELKVEI